MLSRLYWYMVEFGLIQTASGLRVYGAGILSSKGETVYSVESPEPQRLRFELTRVMRTDYRIDAFQRTYFVLDSFQQLFDACYGTDFAPLYERYAGRAAAGRRRAAARRCRARPAAARGRGASRRKKIGAPPGSGHDAPNNAVQVAWRLDREG